MARPVKEYQKLTGKGRPPFPASLTGGASRLYLAKDHLLKIESTYWSEKYRRYYLKDIRLLQITKTRSALVTTIVLLLITLFFGGLAILIGSESGIVLGIIGAVFAFFVLVNWVRGPSCMVKITTPLGSDDLFSLSRIRAATKVFDRIVPLIRNAQESIAPADLANRLTVEVPPARSATALPTLSPILTPAQVPPGKKWMAWAFSALLFIHAALSLWQALQPGTWIPPIALTLLVLAFGFCVALLIRPSPGCPRKFTASFIVYLGIYGVILYFMMMQIIFTNPAKMADQNEIYKAMLVQAAKPSGFNLFFQLFSVAGSGILALLVAVFTFSTQIVKVPEVESETPPAPQPPTL